MADLIVRVITPDYGTWLNAFVSAETGLIDAGINQWTVYQDSWNNNNVMVHFIAEDMDRALAFFKSEAFKDINARSGAIERTFYMAQQQGAAAKPAARRAPTAKKPAAKSTTRKTAAKPAATSTESAPAKPRTRTPKKTS